VAVLEITEAAQSMVVQVVVERLNMLQQREMVTLALIHQLKDMPEELQAELLVKAVAAVAALELRVETILALMVAVAVMDHQHFHLGEVQQALVKM
jgi:hypothetical protein